MNQKYTVTYKVAPIGSGYISYDDDGNRIAGLANSPLINVSHNDINFEGLFSPK